MSDKKLAIVTGASRGIGKAIALRLAKEGYFVVGTATSDAGAAAIGDYLAEGGTGRKLNVCDADESQEFVKAVVAEYGAPAVLVNNAAVTRDNLLLRMKQEQWDEVIATDLTAVFRMTKLCLKPMLKTRHGRIITISSVVGLMGNPGQTNYCAAKAGVIGFSKSLALELANYGITVNCVAPGFIDTDMTKALTDEQREAIFAQIPMRRIGDPEDIAHAVAFFASDQAGYITGETMQVNGGMFVD